MYQRTIRHQHQVLPLPKEGDSPPPYPQRSHYIMARVRSSHRSPAAPRDLSNPAEHPLPPPQHTQDLSWCRGTRGHGREGAANPPSLLHPFPRFHARPHLSLPRDGETLPGAASPSGPAVNSGHRHPRTSRRSAVTLPGPSGSERGRGAGSTAGNPACGGGGRGDGRGNAGGSALQPPAPGAGFREEGAARAS